LTKWLAVDPRWGAAGLTASAGVSGWVEFTLLRRALNARIGTTGLPAALVVRLWGAAAISAAVAWALRVPMSTAGPIPSAMVILGVYGVLYFAATYFLRVEECAGALRRITRLVR
jgi:putative peptidoglycan lipid II flippase